MQDSYLTEDILLIKKLREGDADSFEKLYHKHFSRLYNFCNSLTQSKADSDEIVQETFIKIWEKRSSIDPEGNFSAYAYTIARNKIYKRSIQRIKKFDVEQHYALMLPLRSHITDDDVNYRSLKKIINELVGQLPKMQKKVFTLSRVNGLSNREIASQLQLSISTVENHIHLALKSLKRRLFRFYFLIFFLFLFY